MEYLSFNEDSIRKQEVNINEQQQDLTRDFFSN